MNPVTLMVGFLTATLLATPPDVKRPRILGVAHMALYVSDLGKSRAFYKELLGFDEPFSLKRDDGSERINFNIKDPDDHTVEIVEYQPDSWTARERGKYMPARRVSVHLMHLGLLVGSVEPAMKFYRDILGLNEFWRGSASGKELSWINMRVPDGEDYVEFMLYSKPPDEQTRGVKNHVCLVVPSVEKAVAALQSRANRIGYTRPIETRVGTNKKRQANLYDPDGTRIELMEPNTIDGKPVPSSTAPPPRA